jgi:ketohexokinase
LYYKTEFGEGVLIVSRTPRYPEEDSKLRATSLSVRRGGNGPNALEVITQYNLDKPPILIASLPKKDSDDYNFIKESLPGVDLDRSPSHPNAAAAPRSYIIRSAETNSRTIVNYNELNELTLVQLKQVLHSRTATSINWWHIEVRTHQV